MDAELQRDVDAKLRRDEEVELPVGDPGVEGALNGEAAREILRGCVCSRTRMLDRVLSRLFDDSLAPLGIRASQLTVLALIGAMEGLRAADVAQYLEMDKSTVSRSLALLRARGWVEESAGPTRGSRRLDVTANGRTLLRETLPLWRSATERAREALGEESVEALKGAADSFLRLRSGNLNRRGAAP